MQQPNFDEHAVTIELLSKQLADAVAVNAALNARLGYLEEVIRLNVDNDVSTDTHVTHLRSTE